MRIGADIGVIAQRPTSIRREAAGTGDHQTFAAMMRSAGLDAAQLAQGVGSDAASSEPRVVAAQMVSTLFYAPLLAEMREFSIGQKFGGGGRTEEIFGEQLDRYIADAVAISDSAGFTKLIAEQLTRRPDAAEPADRTAREEAA